MKRYSYESECKVSKLTTFESLNIAAGVVRIGRPAREGDLYGFLAQEAAADSRLPDDPLLIRAATTGVAALFLLGYEFPRELTARATGKTLVSGPVQLRKHPDYMSAHYIPTRDGIEELLDIDHHLERLAGKLAVRRHRLPDDIIAKSHKDIMAIFARKYGLPMKPAIKITAKEHDAITWYANAARKARGREVDPEKPVEIFEIHLSTDAFIERFKQRRKR